MIGKKSENVLNRAVKFAVDHDHEYLTLEHVLWSLLKEPVVLEAIRASGADPEAMTRELTEYLKREVPKAPMGTGAGGKPERAHPVATLSIQRLIQRALFHVQSAGKTEIMPKDLLVALFQAKDSQALFVLQQHGVERLDVLNFISHGDSESEGEPGETPDGENEDGDEAPGTQGAKNKGDALSEYCVNLNERARAGKIDPIVGRAHELDRMIQTLCRRRKNNPLLVGEAGVGKTALAEGLALRIVDCKVPDLLQKAVVYSLDMGTLLAGTKFRGDFEQRLKKILSALEAKTARGMMPILMIDEIHTVIGAGAVGGGTLDAANLLKPALSRGELRCIGSTTYAEYRNVFEKDHAMARRFQKIDVAEPSIEDTVQILTGLKPKFEEHHGIQYSNEAIRAAVELSSKHISDRFQPDKAIDVVDEAGAKARLAGRAKTATQAGATLEATDIEEMISLIARIPAKTVSVGQKERLRDLGKDLKLAIFGQDAAIESITTSIRLARSGLRSGDRPVGSFLFAGPTGVGKTELSKQLAHFLGVPFLRFDMSEYSEKHTISRLIGAPPGYVGFEQAGLLTDAALKNPHCVILLDEIEKAHPDIWNVLLQVMDHGTLTDNNGKKADFRNTIIILTSNVGSREMERRPLAMVGDLTGAKSAAATKAIEQTFTPEFRNRIDAIIYFNPLDPVTIGYVVGKQVMELESQLLAKGVEIEVCPEAREWLATKGYDPRMGARPMARLIQDKIKKPLAEEILFGKLEHGGFVRVTLETPDAPATSELKFEITPKEAPESSPPGGIAGAFGSGSSEAVSGTVPSR